MQRHLTRPAVLYICICVASTLGCGVSKPTGDAGSKTSNSAEPNAATGGESTTSEVKNGSRPGSPAPRSGSPAAAVGDDTISAADEARAPVPTSQPSEPARPTPIQPTAEQIARWAEPSHDPLKLLAIRDDDEVAGVSYLTALRDGKHYLLAGSRLTLWSIDRDAPEHEFMRATSEDELVKSFALSPDSSWCAIGTSRGQLTIFQIADRTKRTTKKIGSGGIAQIAIATDGTELATISYDHEISIWRPETLDKKSSFEVDTRGITRLQYLAPTTLLAAGESMSSWDTETGMSIKKYDSRRYQSVIALSPDLKLLAYGAENGLRLWNLETDQAARTIPSDFAQNELAQFSADGSRLATANATTVRVWDVATGKLLQLIDVAGSEPAGVTWISDTGLLLVASVLGPTRIWGTTDNGRTAGLQPLHSAVPLPAPDSRSPATAFEALEVLDLRLFPRLPGSDATAGSHDSISYTAPANMDEVKTFYRYQFGRRGWVETGDPTLGEALRFDKQGFVVVLSAYASSPTETSVNVNHLGRYDLRSAPRFSRSPTETVYEGASTVMYRTQASLLDIETELLRLLHQAGWTAVSRLNSSHDEGGESRNLEFVWNGDVLRVWIQPDREDASKYVIQYSRSMTLHSLPLPADAGLVEWDDTRETQLVANSSQSLRALSEFYDTEMNKQGWLPRESGRSLKDDRCYLAYVRGQQDVSIGLLPLENGKVRILAGRDSQNSWQLARERAGDPAVAEETSDDDAETADAAAAPTQVVSYAAWLRRQGHLATLELLDEYNSQMKEVAAPRD